MAPARRAILAAVASLALAATAAAQTASRVPRVVFVAVGFGSETTAFEVMRSELLALGRVEGQNVALEQRTTDDAAGIPEIARETVQSQPDVILAINPDPVDALRALTTTIPIVVAFSGDPVALGYTSNVARPTGNVTGIHSQPELLIGKRLEILRTLVPAARRVGVLYNILNASYEPAARGAERAAKSLAMEPVFLGVTSPGDIVAALDRATAERLDGVVMIPSPLMTAQRRAIIETAKSRRLPIIHGALFEAMDGAVASYGIDPSPIFQRAAEYVDRLLRGAKVADLPFDTPRGFVLAINMATARAMGIEVPTALLAAADEVIE